MSDHAAGAPVPNQGRPTSPGDVGGQGQSVLAASSVMAVGTILSRITGFVRAGMLAAAIGLSLHADAFNVANTIPNSVYILVAGGVFNSVLVPQLVRAIKNDPDGGDAYANRVITLGAIVLAAVTAILIAFAPQLLHLFVDDRYFTDPSLAAERESMIDFTRWCLPQVFFYGAFVLIGQILNARGRFGPMMWAPIANNLLAIGVITAYLILYHDAPTSGGYTTPQEVLLGLGSTLGIVAQTAVLFPYLRASGFLVRPRFDFLHTGLGHTLRLGLWTIGFVIVNQIAFFVVVHRATAGSAAVAGGNDEASGYSVYSNAFLLTQVPHSIVTVSLVTATMPLASRLAADNLLGDVAREISQTLRYVLSVIVPFAVALLVLGPAIATILFSWGQAAGDTTGLGRTLIAFAPGVIFFSMHYTALRGFYSLEDTRTPFFIQCAIAAVNIGLAIALTTTVSPEWVAPALALAYGGSYLVGSGLSVALLAHRLGGLDAAGLLRFIGRVAAAAIPAAVVAWLAISGLSVFGLDVESKADSLVLLLIAGVLGLATYLLAAKAAGVTEISRIVSAVAARARRN
jgi:putative peptidoglycan lipid II flippase